MREMNQSLIDLITVNTKRQKIYIVKFCMTESVKMVCIVNDLYRCEMTGK